VLTIDRDGNETEGSPVGAAAALGPWLWSAAPRTGIAGRAGATVDRWSVVPRANGWAGLGAARAVPGVVANPENDGLELPAVDR
jgi:hypothetical protein